MDDPPRYWVPWGQYLERTISVPFTTGDAILAYVAYHPLTDPEVTASEPLTKYVHQFVPPVVKKWGPLVADVWARPIMVIPSGVIDLTFTAKVMCGWAVNVVVAPIPILQVYARQIEKEGKYDG